MALVYGLQVKTRPAPGWARDRGYELEVEILPRVAESRGEADAIIRDAEAASRSRTLGTVAGTVIA